MTNAEIEATNRTMGVLASVILEDEEAYVSSDSHSMIGIMLLMR